jgi:hypothetical protein
LNNKITFGPPKAPALTSPANGSTGHSGSVLTEWNASKGIGDVTYILTYHLQVDNHSNFSSPHLSTSNLSNRQYNVTGLAGGTKYFWRVRGKNSFGYGGFSGARSFTTELVVPAKPVLQADGATSDNRPKYKWTAVPGATSYKVWRRKGSSGNWDMVANTSATFFTDDDGVYTVRTGIYNERKEYFYRMKAYDSMGESPYSDLLSRYLYGMGIQDPF